MVHSTLSAIALLAALSSRVSAHATIFHNSMWGFNQSTAPNRPLDPLINLPFDQWWFHGHLDFPPHPDDIFQLPVGGTAHTEIACDKGVTSWYPSAPGGDQRRPDDPSPCPGQPMSEYHTNGITDLGGCAIAVAYESDVNNVKPEDFAVFSVNHTCVWTRDTDFQIPAAMPPCPDDKCTCAWFWIHKADSGAEQMYMTGFQCNFQGATSDVPVARSQVPKRCGADADNNVPANPSNCTLGAKTPFYWYQAEGNNMFEGTYTPPLYTDLYDFKDGAQNDIFSNSTPTAPPTTPTYGASKRWTGPTPAAVRPARRAPALSGSQHARHAWGQHRRMVGSNAGQF